MDDLDRKAWPTRPAVFDQYLGVSITNVLAGRGCYGDCSFCSINAWHRKVGGRRFRQRSLEDLTAEIADLYHRRGVRIFNFHDDNFFLPTAEQNLARFTEWRDRLKAAGLGRIAIQVKARPDCVEERVIAVLKEIGLFRVFLGVESNAVAGLKALGRGIRREQNHQALAILRAADLHVTYNLLMFEPDCLPSDLRDNIDFIRQHEDVPQNFCGVVVYSGTALERRLREQGRLEGDFFGYHYRIADDRCQRAYEVFRRVFTPRNFLLGGMNLHGMAVDYNLHILKHFFPRAAGAGITRRAKDFLRRLNRNNADLLEEALDFAEQVSARRDWSPSARDGAAEQGGPAADSDAETAAFAEGMSRRREAFDRKLARQCEAVLARMRALAEREANRKDSLVRRASAAAAAAILVMGGTHGCEMAPKEAKAAQPAAQPVIIHHATEMAPLPPASHPTSRSATKPASQPTSNPATKPTSKPATQPTSIPAPPRPPREFPPTQDFEMAPAPPMDRFPAPTIAPYLEAPAPRPMPGPIRLPTHETEMAPMPPPVPPKPPATAPASSPTSAPTQPTSKPASQPTSRPIPIKPPTHFGEMAPAPLPVQFQPRPPAQINEMAGPLAPLPADRPPTHAEERAPMPPPPPPRPLPTTSAVRSPASAPASRPASGPTRPTTQGTTQPTPQAVLPFSEQETQDIQKYLQKEYGAKLQDLATKQNAFGLAEVPVYLELDASGQVRRVRVDLPSEEHAKFKARVELDIIASWSVPNPPRAGSCTVRLPIAKPPQKTHIFEMAPRD